MPVEYPKAVFTKEMGLAFAGGGIIGIPIAEFSSGFLEGLTKLVGWKAVGLRALWKLILGTAFIGASEVPGLTDEARTLLKAGGVVIPCTIMLDVYGKLVVKEGTSTVLMRAKEVGELSSVKLKEAIKTLREKIMAKIGKGSKSQIETTVNHTPKTQHTSYTYPQTATLELTVS